MSTKTGTAQVTMEDTIKQLVKLAKGYVSYARKCPTRCDYITFEDKNISGRIFFVDEVWFVRLGDVEITTNANMITFPYSHTLDNLVETCTLYTSYLDKLNTDLSKRKKTDVEAERRAEIERLKSKLAQLESGEIEPEPCPF